MSSRSNLALFLSLVCAALLAACTAPAPEPVPDVFVPERDREVAAAFPTISELYSGMHGIYRGCGPNGNVCHNARQYPNMNTLGSLVLNVNRPCNQLQDDPARMDDWCERAGDSVTYGGATLQLAYIQRISEATELRGSRWAIAVEGPLPTVTGTPGLSIVRPATSRGLIYFGGDELERDALRPNVIFAQLGLDDYRERRLDVAGIPGNPEAIQFGDPNRNGEFGARLGNALILAGHPERSYLIKRLIDPTAGPLMPLANCCFWTRPAMRALWCWIAGMPADGSNTLGPIDYEHCPEGPPDTVLYPEPGPMCQAAGMCPVRAREAVPDDPTWPNVYNNILARRCAGTGCHLDGAPAGLDLRSIDVAYASLLDSTPPRVLPRNAIGSTLHIRLTQACMDGQQCRRMPLGAPPLPANEISIIARWIEGGALQSGNPSDAAVDAATDATGDTATDVASEVSVDAGTDAPIDAGMDSGMDVEMDSGVVVMDTGVDSGPAMDAGMDTSAPDAAD